MFMTEVVSNASHGIDLHTAAIHRNNLPQIRGDLDDPGLDSLARAFGVPVLLNASGPEGSLRRVATEQGVPTLIYEAGEALRFDETSIRAGVRGIINMMRHLEMLPASSSKRRKHDEPFVARSTTWIRSPESGICRASLPLGARVARDDKLGVIADPFGEKERIVTSPISGVVIGRTNLPLVNEGDALFHIARFEKLSEVAQKVEAFQEESQVGYPETLDEPPLA
jgi:predicted deacylase